MKRRTPRQIVAMSRRINILKALSKRGLALVLCFAIILPLVMVTRSVQAAGEWNGSNPISLKDLYTREADINTMDSYVQASLGGFIYTDRDGVDAVTTPTVRNNFGSRYAGEVWADKSVFARYQPYIAEIRPFEEGKSYDADQLPDGYTDLAGRLLDATQANMLNKAANVRIQKYYDNYKYDPNDPTGGSGYGFTGDGDFDGETLILERHTDGYSGKISLKDTDADFLHVFSVLGSSQEEIGITPLDVVMVLDVSGSMENSENPNSRIAQSIEAMNDAIATLMDLNINNRVGVVVFASRPAVLMELGRYEPWGKKSVTNTDGTTTTKDVYIGVTGCYEYSTTNHYYEYTLKASKDNARYEDAKDKTATVNTSGRETTSSNTGGFSTGDGTLSNGKWDGADGNIGSNTNMDSGFWTGLGLLASADETVVTINNKQLSRIPSFIFLGDGDPQYMMAQSGGNWWDPTDPSGRFTLNSASFNNASVIASTVMRVALMKAAVNNHYQDNAKNAENASDVKLGFYTIGVVMGQTGHATGLAVATAIMNPGDESKLGFKSENRGYYTLDNNKKSVEVTSATSGAEQSVVYNAYAGWYFWSEGKNDGALNGKYDTNRVSISNNGTVTITQGYNTRTFAQFPVLENIESEIDKEVYNALSDEERKEQGVPIKIKNNITGKNVTTIVTKQDVLDSFPYTTEYFNANTASEISTKLNSIIQMISTPIWNPVSGTNSSGVQDSLTYSDPIGEYMEIDDVTDVILFGRRYKVRKRAVYDYAANEAIIAKGITDPSNSNYIRQGWYDSENNLLPLVNGLPPGVSDAADAWERGYTFRITYATAQQFVPTLEEGISREQLTEKQKNTTYTVYSIVWELDKDGNKIGGTDVEPNSPRTSTRTNLSYSKETDEEGLKHTFDLLEDIHIWIEDTGDWHDVGEGGFIVDSGYSEALYINIGANALPVQIASITMKSDPNSPTGSSPKSYSTNLNNTSNGESTPLRVFYNVSFDKEYLRYMDAGSAQKRDKSQAVGVALSKISSEYLENHVTGEDEGKRQIYFYSNYFTNNVYDGYPVKTNDENTISRGNPDVSFAPNGDNEFYRFRKNRVLYLIPGATGDDARPAEINLGALEKDYAEAKAKGESEEKLKAMDPTTVEGLQSILNAKRVAIGTPYSAYDCIPVTGDHQKMIYPRGTSGGSGGVYIEDEINSDNWYYIIREYYYPIFEGDKSGATDNVEVRYEAIARKGSELGSGLAKNDNVGSEVQWYNPSKASGENTREFKGDPNADHWGRPFEYEDHRHDDGWYIAARPGGLRVGGLSNFVGTKGYDIREGVNTSGFSKDDSVVAASNRTGTARTYILPTISSYTNANDNTDVAVNIFLGNNGRILVDDTMLLVTKTVNTIAGGEAGSGQQSSRAADTRQEMFEYTAEIEGFYGFRGAIVVTRDEFDRNQWRRRFETIDVLTDNLKFLLGDDNQRAMVDEKGERIVSRVETESAGNGTTRSVTKYYYARKNIDGTLVKDKDGNILLGAEVAADKVYYVYLGQNVRINLYGDKALRVFEADTTGNLYGNQSLRGGRTYYLTKDQYDELDENTKKMGAVVGYPGEDASGDLSEKVAFRFQIIGEDGDGIHQVGDREYWVNRVYLIPMSEVANDKNWKWDYTDYERYDDYVKANGAGYDQIDEWHSKDSDWRTGYGTQGVAKALADETGYILINRFLVATLRASDKTGNTSDTMLISDGGYGMRSSFMTTQVEFKNTGDGSGRATFYLADGDGLLFNNINNGSWYAVTEVMTDAQANKGIRLQQVDHVQEEGLRTRYVYNTGNPLCKSGDPNDNPIDGVTTKDIRYSKTGQEDGSPREIPERVRPFLENVGVERSYKTATGGAKGNGNRPGNDPDNDNYPPAGDGNDYFWWGGEPYGDSLYSDIHLETTANFKNENLYIIAGDTSVREEAVHYVNFIPDIAKLEFTPGEGESVYVGDEITYGIRWENFEYSTVDGTALPATVTIRDPLDAGVDFVRATFNPDHGNMYDYDNGTDKQMFNEANFVKQFKELLANEGQIGDIADSSQSGDQSGGGGQSGGGSLMHWRDKDFHLNAGEGQVTKNYGGNNAPGGSVASLLDTISVTISYDADKHEVIWKIDQAPANTYGYVELTVRVNSSAIRGWDYDRPDNDDRTDVDNRVVNRAGVTVGNHPERFTEIIENPTGTPHKTETNPGAGTQVAEGQVVDYTVEWSNTKSEAATITIKDRLDPGVNFYRASIKGDGENGGEVYLDPNKAPQDMIEEDLSNGYAFYSAKDSKDSDDTDGNYTVSGGNSSTSTVSGGNSSVSSNDSYTRGGSISSAVSEVIGEYAVAMRRANTAQILRPSYMENGDIVAVLEEYPDTTEEPESTKEPDTTGEPESTKEPNTTEEPESTKEPDTTEEPGSTEYPDTTEEPGSMDEPDTTEEPGSTEGLDTTEEPGITDELGIMLEELAKPEMTADVVSISGSIRVGDTIIYKITWKNDTDEAVTVTITDMLDPGVDYVDAQVTDERESDSLDGGNESGQDNSGCTVGYDKDTHTVTWTLENREARTEGSVSLTVKINDKVYNTWKYNEDDGEIVQGIGEDGKAVNKARIQVGDNVQYTDVVETVVEPTMKIISPGIDGTTAQIGDTITYSIWWRNDYSVDGMYTATNVTITDRLDPGLDFVEAGFLDSSGNKLSNNPSGCTAVYDSNSRTVTWILPNQNGGAEGEVYLIVKVNDNAPKGYEYDGQGNLVSTNGNDDKVVNKAYVDVDRDSKQYTNTVEITVRSKPKKTVETTSISGSIRVGDMIVYKITWTNDASETSPDGKAKVTITDQLDPGVSFVRAGFGEDADANREMPEPMQQGNPPDRLTVTWQFPEGMVTVEYHGYEDDGSGEDSESDKYSKYSKVTVTWTWNEQSPGENGTVYLVAKVNDKAQDNWTYEQQGGQNNWLLTQGIGEDDRVVNIAQVKVENGSDQYTNLVESTVVVDETVPKEFQGYTEELAKRWGTLSTKAAFENTKSETEPFNTKVMLDNRVDRPLEVNVTIEYDPENRTITWMLDKVPAFYSGRVSFSVIVNELADYEWVPDPLDPDPSDKDLDGGSYSDDELNRDKEDDRIYNRARVKVGEDHWVYTNTIENPTKPEKAETTPGDGQSVQIGEKITYTITWLNDAKNDAGQPIEAKVTIIDRLDPGVSPVFDDYDGDGKEDNLVAGYMSLVAGGRYAERRFLDEYCTVVYDEATHTVTWTLDKRSARATGMVFLTVVVNENAYKDWHYREGQEREVDDKDKGAILPGSGEDNKVVNKARVKVENGSDQMTKIVENPVPETPDGPKERRVPEDPDDPNKPGVPKTGDDSQLGLWVTLLALCLSGLIAMAFYTGRKRFILSDGKTRE